MDTTKTSQADEDATWNQELKSLLRLLIAQSHLKKTKNMKNIDIKKSLACFHQFPEK